MFTIAAKYFYDNHFYRQVHKTDQVAETVTSQPIALYGRRQSDTQGLNPTVRRDSKRQSYPSSSKTSFATKPILLISTSKESLADVFMTEASEDSETTATNNEPTLSHQSEHLQACIF